MHFTILRSEEKHHGRIVNLVLQRIRYASGNETVREIVEHPGGAVALGVFENGEILLVKQFRHPINGEVIELPAGKLDAGEDPLHCAQRELQEETGYASEQWTKLTTMMTTPGFCNERLHIYLAEKIFPSPKGQALEEGEQSMQLMRVTLADAIAMIERGEIGDSKTIAGIFLGERKLKK